MVSDLLKELVAGVVADVVGEAVFPKSSSERPEEGEWNASLGSLSFFLGAVAGLFALPS